MADGNGSNPERKPWQMTIGPKGMFAALAGSVRKDDDEATIRLAEKSGAQLEAIKSQCEGAAETAITAARLMGRLLGYVDSACLADDDPRRVGFSVEFLLTLAEGARELADLAGHYIGELTAGRTSS